VKDSYGAPSDQRQNHGGNYRQPHPVDYNQNSAYNGGQQNESADPPEPFMSARVGLGQRKKMIARPGSRKPGRLITVIKKWRLTKLWTEFT